MKRQKLNIFGSIRSSKRQFPVPSKYTHVTGERSLDLGAGELDVLGASAGVFYENVPRASLKHHEVVDLLQVSANCRRLS